MGLVVISLLGMENAGMWHEHNLGSECSCWPKVGGELILKLKLVEFVSLILFLGTDPFEPLKSYNMPIVLWCAPIFY